MWLNFSPLLVTALTVTERLFIFCLLLKDWSQKASTEYLDSANQWKRSSPGLTKVCFTCFCTTFNSQITLCACLCLWDSCTTLFYYKMTYLWKVSAALVVKIQSWYFTVCGQRRTASGGYRPGTLPALKTAMKKKRSLLCWDSVVDLVRIKMSWPGAVWILTARKTLQQWAKLLARSACGRSSMTECHSSSQHCDVQSASTSRPWPALKSMRNPEKVRIKQARRMIAATLQKYWARLLFFSFSPWLSLFPNLLCDVRLLMWAIFSEKTLTFFSLSPPFHHSSSQMARRQTSQWMPMKTSISSRVHWNCTSGICLFLSSHSTLTPGSSRLQVRHNQTN